MACIVCKEASKYKCPTCLAGYCSVKCFKEHKDQCEPPKPQLKDSPRIVQETTNDEFDEWLKDPKLRALVDEPALQHHLRVVAQIVHEDQISGESTDEGRRMVAIKKLRELRMGGREQNEAVEEFVQTVVERSA